MEGTVLEMWPVGWFEQESKFSYSWNPSRWTLLSLGNRRMQGTSTTSTHVRTVFWHCFHPPHSRTNLYVSPFTLVPFVVCFWYSLLQTISLCSHSHFIYIPFSSAPDICSSSTFRPDLGFLSLGWTPIYPLGMWWVLSGPLFTLCSQADVGHNTYHQVNLTRLSLPHFRVHGVHTGNCSLEL